MTRLVWALVVMGMTASSVSWAQDVAKKDVKRWTKACEKKADAAACQELAAGYQAGRGAAMPKSLENTVKYAGMACEGGVADGCQIVGEMVVTRYKGGVLKANKAQEAVDAFSKACGGGRAESCTDLSTFVEGSQARKVLSLTEREQAHRTACDGGAEAVCGWADALGEVASDDAAAATLDDAQTDAAHQGIGYASKAIRACMRKAGFGSADEEVELTLRVAQVADYTAVRSESDTEVPGVMSACMEDAFSDLDAPLFEGEGFVSTPMSVTVDEDGLRVLSLPELEGRLAAACAEQDIAACHALGQWSQVSGGASNPDLTEGTGCEEGAARGRVVTSHINSRRVDAVLDRDVIDAVIKQQFQPVMACKDAKVDCSDLPRVQIDVRIEVAPTGVVCGAEVTKSTLDGDSLGTFVAAQMEKLRFPALAPGKRLVLTYPFVFQKGK